MHHGKKYKDAAAKVDKMKAYEPAEAISLLKEVSTSSFDGTVELHIRLGVDPRHSDQQVRGVAILPAGSGRKVRILVFAEGDNAKAAEDAGAEYVGTDEFIKKIQGGWLEFDVVLATPDMMQRVAAVAKILGPRGLMPSPKAETVTTDVRGSIDQIRKGRVQFAVDKVGVIHCPIGKISFEESQIMENFVTMVDAVTRAKPAASKGQYVKSVSLAPTMGPSIHVDVNSTLAMEGVSAAGH
jgi:large subunit ribosomal protein L1